MRNCDFLKAKEAILNGNPVTKKEWSELMALKADYQEGIAKATVKGEVEKAIFFRKDLDEILELLRIAKVKEAA